VAALARDVDIFYNTAVDTVEYGGFPGDGETSDVTGKQSHESQSETKSFTNATKSVNDDGVSVLTTDGRVFVADAVVVTVPLGVLKRGDLRFVPELPVRKKTAIENLGFGALNKVLLLFPTTFWDTRHDTFGWVNSCDNGSEHRGRFFMFYSYHGAELSGGSTLIALIAGDAALSMETIETDSEIVAGVMTVLRQIFARQGKGVPSPVDSTVTRWGTDPYARGSYSNISPRGTGEDCTYWPFPNPGTYVCRLSARNYVIHITKGLTLFFYTHRRRPRRARREQGVLRGRSHVAVAPGHDARRVSVREPRGGPDTRHFEKQGQEA
jgi:lysine-specific histone demethylase 1